MNFHQVQPVVDAVLYEGYILYPYRPTAAKNRQRWTFGGIYPKVYAAATDDSEPWHMQTQCLVEGDTNTRLEIRVRFLHPLAREVGELTPPVSVWPQPGKGGPEPAFRLVPSLTLGDRQFYSWQEVVERELVVADGTLGDMLAQGASEVFSFDGQRELEPLDDGAGQISGVLLRRQTDIQGRIEVGLEPLADGVFKLSVGIENRTTMDPSTVTDREEASLYSFASTHTLLGVEGGQFISLMDPPSHLESAAAACNNQGAFPILVGQPGSHDTLLSSPIILYDYPEVAPESPGDFFDSTEIDEILSLRILAMTDAEKQEMAATEPRAAALLARTEALDGDDFMRLHGTLRDPYRDIYRDTGHGHAQAEAGATAITDNPLEPPPGVPHLVSCRLGDRELQVGDPVRLCPRNGGDVMDLVLAGKTAVIEAIERDFEDRVHVAVTIDDDPGREWGLERMPGHRFFFSPEELESLSPPIGQETQP